METVKPLNRKNTLIDQAMSPAFAANLIGEIGALVQNYLSQSQSGNVRNEALDFNRVISAFRDFKTPNKNFEINPETWRTSAKACAQLFLANGTQLHSPLCMGHQVPPPVPAIPIMQMLGGLTNQSSAVFEMGPAAAAIEKAVIGLLLPYLQWDAKNSDAVVTSGGSVANLTALLTARAIAEPRVWEHGVGKERDLPFIFAGADSHYSISRAAAIMGIGAQQVHKIALDEGRRMCAEQLRTALKLCASRGQRPIAIVATSGSTPVGAFDPLNDIAAVAKEFGIWLHIDAAHGGGFLLSPKYRHLLTGVSLADSVTWDAHKMMFAPALATFVFYRRKTDSFKTFSQDAPYLLDGDDAQSNDRDGGLRTLECTKPTLLLGLWSAWHIFGEKLFADLVEQTVEKTRFFYEMLADTEDFVPFHEPESNILCFQYIPAAWRELPLEELNRRQLKIREAIVAAGAAYLTGTVLNGVYCLRVTVMNPKIASEHFEELCALIRKAALVCGSA